MRSMLVWLMVFFGSVAAAAPAHSEGPECQPAELFLTDSESPLFELQADVSLTLNRAAVTGSTLVDGVLWSTELQQIAYERALSFICAWSTSPPCIPPPRRCAASSTNKPC